jgi:hypothetical protein
MTYLTTLFIVPLLALFWFPCATINKGKLNTVSILATLPVVLYGCETWPLKLNEKHKLGAFEDEVLRKTFVRKREVTGAGENSTLRRFMTPSPRHIRRVRKIAKGDY